MDHTKQCTEQVRSHPRKTEEATLESCCRSAVSCWGGFVPTILPRLLYRIVSSRLVSPDCLILLAFFLIRYCNGWCLPFARSGNGASPLETSLQFSTLWLATRRVVSRAEVTCFLSSRVTWGAFWGLVPVQAARGEAPPIRVNSNRLTV